MNNPMKKNYFSLSLLLMTLTLASCEINLPSYPSVSSDLSLSSFIEGSTSQSDSDAVSSSIDITFSTSSSSSDPFSSESSSSSTTTTSNPTSIVSSSSPTITSSNSPSTSSSSNVTIPSNAPNYYNGINPALTGTTLKSALQSLIGSNYTVNYDWSRYLFADESLTDSNAVITIYPKVNYPKENRVGSSQPPGYWNREHTYPQSKIGTTARSDTHHIFADDHSTNSQRGDKRFNVVAHTESNRVKDSLNRATNNFQTSTFFEPNDIAKGEVARATLYLNTLYGYSLDGNFASNELAVLWSLQYPVDDWSMRRNNRVYEVQGNRNPYIDNPSWICAVYGQTSAATQQVCTA
jgi:endonuclease I